MYEIPKENWGEFLSQGDTMWCWAYALGGIFGLTKHEEIAKLHDTLGMTGLDGEIADGAAVIGVMQRAKEQGYINDYENILFAYKPRRIEEIMESLEKGIPLFMSKKDSSIKDHAVRVIGFDEEKEQYLVIDSGKINYSPLSISYDTCKALYSVDLTPENYAKIDADFKVDITEVEKDETVIEPEKEEIKPEEPTENTMKFIDVKKTDWFYNNVKSLFDKGIVKGEEEDRFGTGHFLTKEEVSVMIDRAIAYTIGQCKKD